MLGYKCAIKVEEARAEARMKIKISRRRTFGTQTKCLSSRTIGAQSMCTYKRKLLTPRFKVLPDMADGVFDVTFSMPVDDD